MIFAPDLVTFVVTLVNTKQVEMIRNNCQNCGQFVWIEKHRLKYGKGKYCSRHCAIEGQKKGKYKDCKHCGKSFYVQKRSLKRKGRGQYCSEPCKNKSQEDRVIKKCKNCGKEMEVERAIHERGHGKYCSDVCKAKHYWSTGKFSTLYPNTSELRDIVRKRKWGRKAVKNLNDWYCKNKLSESTNYSVSHKNIPQKLVETKRQHLKIKRLIKDQKQ